MGGAQATERTTGERGLTDSLFLDRQIFIVSDKEEELKVLEEQDEVPNGITPPNTNVTKRKFEKTKRHTPFPVRPGTVPCLSREKRKGGRD